MRTMPQRRSQLPPPIPKGQPMTLEEWIQLGRDAGLELVQFCAAHEMPYTWREAAAFEEGEDPCIPAVRMIPEEGKP